MTRSFRSDSVDPALLESCIDLGLRAPSAGKSQGWHVLLLQGQETSRYWDTALPQSKRENFAFPHLLAAPVNLSKHGWRHIGQLTHHSRR
jgi:nitroreductase